MTGNNRGPEAAQAAKAATKTLRERHKDEYAELLATERVVRGLPPRPERPQKSARYLLEQLDKLEQREAKIRRELAARGVEPE